MRRLAIVLPISAFVAWGFEHSIATLYALPLGMPVTTASGAPIGLLGALQNLVAVTIGNVLGGSVLVDLVYWFVYLQGEGQQNLTRFG